MKKVQSLLHRCMSSIKKIILFARKLINNCSDYTNARMVINNICSEYANARMVGRGKSQVFTWYATASYLGRAYQIKITELVEPIKFELFLCFLFFNMVFGRNYVACVSIVIFLIKRIAQLPLISAGLSSVQKSHSIILRHYKQDFPLLLLGIQNSPSMFFFVFVILIPLFPSALSDKEQTFFLVICLGTMVVHLLVSLFICFFKNEPVGGGPLYKLLSTLTAPETLKFCAATSTVYMCHSHEKPFHFASQVYNLHFPEILGSPKCRFECQEHMDIRNDLRLAKVPGSDIHLYLDDNFLPDKGKIKAAVDSNPQLREAFVTGVTNGRIPEYDLMPKSAIVREAETVIRNLESSITDDSMSLADYTKKIYNPTPPRT
jgi:hypothetical protein